jgi:hypothetical protein
MMNALVVVGLHQRLVNSFGEMFTPGELDGKAGFGSR